MIKTWLEKCSIKLLKSVNERYLCWFTVVCIGLLLIPLFWISFYNVPSADDFGFAADTYHTWKETQSIPALLAAAAKSAHSVWNSWTGVFTCTFMWGLLPCIFDPSLYVLGGWIMLGMLLTSEIFFCWVVFRRIFSASVHQSIIISVVWVGLSTQLLPDVTQGFYWQCGAMLYTFFFSASLFLYGTMILFALGGGRWGQILRFGVILLLAFFIGGGNYITALSTAIFMPAAIVFLFVSGKKRSIYLIIPYLVFWAAFAISIVAPGNAVRGANFVQPGALAAIFLSFRYALSDISAWLNLPTVAALLFLTPILWRIAQRISFSFRFPPLVLLLAYCFLASQYCPTIYATGGPPITRMLNIVYFTFLFLLIFVWFYTLGWFSRQLDTRGVPSECPRALQSVGLVVCSLVMVALGCLSDINDKDMSSISAAKSLAAGEAQQYYSEYQDRLDILLDDSIINAHLSPFSVYPPVLYFLDATSDVTDWRNTDMSRYFGKESIIVE